MNHADEIERMLRRWGRVFGPPPPSEWDEESSGNAGALTSIAMQIVRVGVAAIKPEPFGDGLGYTAKGRPSEGGASRWQPDLEAESVETAWLDLWREHKVQAVVLRQHYCARGPMRDKIKFIRQATGVKNMHTRRAYNVLDNARDGMAERLFTARSVLRGMRA